MARMKPSNANISSEISEIGINHSTVTT